MAVAGHLGLMGFPVRLWARSAQTFEAVRTTGGVYLEGSEMGFGPVQACSSLREALFGADLVLVAVPAYAHGEMARVCAPFLQSGQKVLLMPGRTAGAIEFLSTLRRHGCMADVLVGESQTFIYASRVIGPGRARIHGVKRQVQMAALPASRTAELLEVIRPAYPQFMPARWVWKTSLDNIGAVFHPAVALLNAGRIESTGGAFRHYADGITQSVARLLERLDAERVAVARALGVGALTAREWLSEVYGVDRPSLYEAIQATPAYAAVGAPGTMETRYIWEDVPTGLVPLSSLGHALSIRTPTIDSIIEMADIMCCFDFRSNGRTLERLGMAGWSRDQFSHYALEGEVTNLV